VSPCKNAICPWAYSDKEAAPLQTLTIFLTGFWQIFNRVWNTFDVFFWRLWYVLTGSDGQISARNFWQILWHSFDTFSHRCPQTLIDFYSFPTDFSPILTVARRIFDGFLTDFWYILTDFVYILFISVVTVKAKMSGYAKMPGQQKRKVGKCLLLHRFFLDYGISIPTFGLYGCFDTFDRLWQMVDALSYFDRFYQTNTTRIALCWSSARSGRHDAFLHVALPL